MEFFNWMFLVLSCTNSYARNDVEEDFLGRIEMAHTFDQEIVPRTQGEPMKVFTSMFIVSMDNLDLTSMDYKIDFYLYHEWKDDKLKHSNERDIVLDVGLHNKIWVPDTYIVNSKQSHFHKVVLDNKKIQVTRNGRVKLKFRLTARASCPVDLRNFPWDVQHCSLLFESYAYDDTMIQYHWLTRQDNANNLVAPNVKDLSQYSLIGVATKTKKTAYAIGNWSTLEITFHLKRYSGLYLILVMGPSIITVLISWVTFIIGHDQHPARISLGITSILTMEAIHFFIESSLPKVSYMTLLNAYSFISNIFVLLAMCEYAVVLLVARKEKHNKKQRKSKVKKKEQKNKEESLQEKSSEEATEVKEKDDKEEHKSKHCCGKSLKERLKIAWNARKININTAYKIDSFSRIFFPFSFILFNFIFAIFVIFMI